MEAHEVIVKSESSPAPDLATEMAEDMNGSDDHGILPGSMGTEPSCIVLVKSIPAHLDAWVILNSETRFSLGLTGMAVLPAPESDKSTRFASLEYSEMVYAEAFMYRSAQPLLKKYGMICTIVSQLPRNGIPQTSREQPKTAIRDQSGPSPRIPSTLRSEISQDQRTATLDDSDDDCIIVSSRPVKPGNGMGSLASTISTQATPDSSASTKSELLGAAAQSMNNISMSQLLINPETSVGSLVEAPASSAPRSSAAASSVPASSAPRSSAPRSSAPRLSAPDSSAPGSSVPGSSAPPTSTAQPIPPMRENNTNTSAAITTAKQRFLLSGIQRLSNREEATYFAQPVSFSQMRLLGIPHYPDIIKKPMDLRTMEEKLKFGKYGCIDDYVSDFDQMVENSLIFNGPRHGVTKDGLALKACFEQQIRNSTSVVSTKGPIRILSNTPRPPGRPRKWRSLEQEMRRSRSTKRGREALEVSDDAPLTTKTNDTTFTPKADDRLPERKKQVRQAAIIAAENLRVLSPANWDE